MKQSIFAIATLLSLIQASPTPQELAKRDNLSLFVPIFAGYDKTTGSANSQGTRDIPQPYDEANSREACATKCKNTANCACFNIYVETIGSTATAKCALYKAPSGIEQATNPGGQSRVAGGPLTEKSKSALYCLSSAVSANYDIAGYTYTCYPNAYTAGPVLDYSSESVTLAGCAAWCDYHNAEGTSCPFFNFYKTYKDGAFQYATCRISQVARTAADATNVGPTDDTGTYLYTESCGYTRTV
ncbi:hypothetical protein Dda_6392 [Drechslerella dactyloides]|uniref:Apple domain-containing protein n=1 Tax=Drechslerella dactyloides TaxID=74499 RepID=A0AAD6NHH4_DREDA|nr:hypothetical protein Dda_6392 [Drechslerella dactyloides]